MTAARRPWTSLWIGVLSLTLLALGPEASLLARAETIPPLPVGTMARQGSPDLEGPTIANVRASPPLARPGEFVSLAAIITDPSGVRAAWVLIEGPEVDLNLTLVAFGDAWFLNRSWETPGSYRFEIGAQDGVGNVNTAPGSFQVQESLAGTVGLVLLLGTLLATGTGALVYLWIRRKPAGRGRSLPSSGNCLGISLSLTRRVGAGETL